MENNDRNKNHENNKEGGFDFSHMLIRILVTAIVVGIAAYFTPGFTINGIWSLLLASIVIGVIDHLVQKFTGVSASPFGKGITGFLVAAIILYVTKFIVAGFNISIWGAIIGALMIGIVDAIIPGRAM